MSGYIDENARIADDIHNAYEEGYADGKRDAVVRCKDCKYYHEYKVMNCSYHISAVRPKKTYRKQS